MMEAWGKWWHQAQTSYLEMYTTHKMSHRDWDIKCKVYIGGLGNNASKFEIEDAFTKYGPLRNIWVARNPPGFAFVEFEDPRDAEDSARGLDGTRMCGNRVRVEMSSGKRRERNYDRPPRGGRRGGLLDVISTLLHLLPSLATPSLRYFFSSPLT
ncbi:hypothetical protein M8J77_006419 [Diaphorina citri]|nr:hypothetical protein M8J77_006419 [Diaphorina citri]